MRQEAIDENNIEKIAQSEYDFTTKKINESFSNFSAWYQRTRLLPEIVQKLPEQERNSIAKDGLLLLFTFWGGNKKLVGGRENKIQSRRTFYIHNVLYFYRIIYGQGSYLY